MQAEESGSTVPTGLSSVRKPIQSKHLIPKMLPWRGIDTEKRRSRHRMGLSTRSFRGFPGLRFETGGTRPLGRFGAT